MKFLRQLFASCVLLGALAGTSAVMAADAPESAGAKPPAKDLVLKGDAKCTSCHDETDEPKLLHIGKTKHGTVADGRTPSCSNCHGDSDLHTNNPAKLKERPPTDRNFSKTSKTSAEDKSAACTTCHQGGKHMNWNTSAHATRDVSCTSCHQIHTGKDKVRDKRTQPEVCYTCSDCHNAHGSAGPKMLVKDTTNATCFTCHAEKRGPFVHNHQPVVEDCGNCHNPHGTSAEAMLKARQPFLCQQCHADAAHPGNVPAVRSNMPNAVSSNIGPGYAQGRGCSNCHTNIHGSNSPSNATSSGPFRFFR
jgi:predicted CXXCH cytochrome family protein